MIWYGMHGMIRYDPHSVFHVVLAFFEARRRTQVTAGHVLNVVVPREQHEFAL